MRGPLGSFFRFHFGYHPPEHLVYSFYGAVGLRMIWRRPNLCNAQQVTQFRYHLSCEFRRLVRHQSPWESKHREKLVVEDARRSARGVVIGDVRLGKACKVILNDQNVLHNRLLCHIHCHFRGDVVDMN